jgi:hypothetical protein
MCFTKFKEDYVQFPSQMKSDPKLPSRCPSVSRRFKLFKLAFVRTLKQHVRTLFRVSEEIQRSSASVWTTWQYLRDVCQCSTSKRISFADTDMGRQLQSSRRQVYTVHTLSLIRQDVKKNCNHTDVRATPSKGHS